jgi:hypothetical protein
MRLLLFLGIVEGMDDEEDAGAELTDAERVVEELELTAQEDCELPEVLLVLLKAAIEEEEEEEEEDDDDNDADVNDEEEDEDEAGEEDETMTAGVELGLSRLQLVAEVLETSGGLIFDNCGCL